MRSRFGQKFSTCFRAVSAISLIVLAGFAISAPMGCGDVNKTTDPTSGGDSKDAIPVSEIVWDGDENPSTWTPVTSIDSIVIENWSSSAPTICWNWTQPTNWPLKDGKSIGNNWIIVKIDGVWHATPWEHLPPGDSVCRTTEANGGQPPFIQGYGPIALWYPTKGDEVGFMNSTIARGERLPGTPEERTYVYKTTWQ
jgi:hypothetical protein